MFELFPGQFRIEQIGGSWVVFDYNGKIIALRPTLEAAKKTVQILLDVGHSRQATDRIILTGDNFRNLVAGRVVTVTTADHATLEIALEDIGFSIMLAYIDEAARQGEGIQ